MIHVEAATAQYLPGGISDPVTGRWRPQFSPEFRLLLLCVEPRPNEAVEHEVARLLESNLVWRRFLFLAAKNQVVPLVYARLNASAKRVPQSVMAILRRRCMSIASWNLFLASELNLLLGLFKEHEICAIPFKGPPLAISLYGDLSLRQGDDLDIFIPLTKLDRAIELMQSCGYRLADHFTGIGAKELGASFKDAMLENAATGLCVELHWAISEPAFHNKLRDFNPCGRKIGAMKLLDAVVPIASVEDTLFLLATHGIRHYWNRLKWICDIVQLRRVHLKLDWDAALATADTFSCRRAFLIPFLLARDLLGVSLPAPLVAPAQHCLKARALLDRISVDLGADMETPLWPQRGPLFRQFAEIDISQKIFRVRSKDSLAERWTLFSKFIGDFIRPDPADLLARPFLSKLTFVFWIIQPLRIARGCGLRFFLRASRQLLAALVQ